MAKSKLHLPAHHSSYLEQQQHRKPMLLPQKSLEDLSAHIQLSLAKVLLPRLCRNCRPVCQKKLERQELAASKQKHQQHQHQRQKSSKCKQQPQQPLATTESIIESICSKCRVAISGIDNTPKRINQQQHLNQYQPQSESHNSRKSRSCSHNFKNKNTNRNSSNSKKEEDQEDTSMSLAQKFKSLFSRFVSYTPISSPVRSPSPFGSSTESTDMNEGNLYARLERRNKHWCHFCGTTGAQKWYPGPWGPRTVCYKHSEQCKGADKVDLSCFLHEKERKEPVVRDYCGKCWARLDVRSACLRCYGCPFAYHVGCVPPGGSKMINGRWFCSEACQGHLEKLGINVNLPYQAIMPFSQVEVVSDKGEVVSFIIPPPPSTTAAAKTIKKQQQQLVDKKRKIEQVIEEESKENSPKKQRPNSIKVVDIPVPGVIRHEMCAARRYQSQANITQANISSTTKARVLEEALDDLTFLNRHKRYETMELSSRICRPQILKKLFKKPQ